MALRFLLGFAVSVVVTPLAMTVARRADLVDRPGPLKVHTQPVPYLGGLGLAAACIVGLVPDEPRLLLPLGLAVVLGLTDDTTDVPAWLRLAGQVAVGVTVAVNVDTRLPIALDDVLVVLTVVGLINGMNMLDGLDGLAGSIGLVATVGFAVVVDDAAFDLSLAAAGGLLGFLVYNRPPAKIYLGNGGSYLLGTVVALLLALAWSEGTSDELSFGALIFVALPVAEVTFAVVRRVRSGRSPLTGDRHHSYDLVMQRGWSAPAAVGACVVVQTGLSVVAVVATALTPLQAAAVAVVVGVGLLVGGGALGALEPDPSGA